MTNQEREGLEKLRKNPYFAKLLKAAQEQNVIDAKLAKRETWMQENDVLESEMEDSEE